jgi:endoglucanase
VSSLTHAQLLVTRYQFTNRPWVLLLAVFVAATALMTSASSTPAAAAARARASDPLSVLPFFVQQHTDATVAVRSYRAAGNVTDENLMERIAGQPSAVWLTGPSSLSELTLTLREAKRGHQLPTYAVYDIPGRDCGSYSSGGAPSAAAYEAWIRQIAARIRSTPVAVIIEPDALPEIACWTSSEQATAYSLIRYAATTLQANPNATVYIDAGNPSWQPVHTMVARLRRAGVSLVRGFALNTSEFETTARSLAYGTRISNALGGKHFVIDTGRNGRGPPKLMTGPNWWCNPPGRGLGLDPTTQTASPLADAYLWVKPPGYSDGPCNGGPPSGDWWPALALSLAENAEQS